MSTKIIYSFLLLFLTSFVPFRAVAQPSELSKAITLFDNGQFTDAEPIFKTILDQKPGDFMVNYFYGACRTENNHFTNADLDCLIKANQEVSPINITYYFGMQYHARSNWERALKFYNKFKSSAPGSEIEARNLLEKIQQCYDKINPYEEFMVKENEEPIIAVEAIDTLPVATPGSTNFETETRDSTSGVEPDVPPTPVPAEVATKSEATEKVPKGKAIQFFVNYEITYLNTSQFRTKEGKSFYEKGIAKEKELEQNRRKTSELRVSYGSAKMRDDKERIGEEILALENETFQLKSDALSFLTQAKNIENEFWQNATSDEIEKYKNELRQLSSKDEPAEQNTITPAADTTSFIDPALLLTGSGLSSKANSSESSDLIYKIQLGAYSRGLPNYVKQLFHKLSTFRTIENYTDPKGIVVYTTGNLTNYEDAVKMRDQIRQEGVKDAYVVPYLKGKRITLEQAKEIEKK